MGSRAIIRSLSDGLQITLHAKRNWVVLFIMFSWLCLWVVGGLSVIGDLAGDKESQASKLGWLVAWAGGCLVVVYTLAWQLIGREEIYSTQSHLRHEKHLGPWVRRRQFDWPEIGHLRYSPRESTRHDDSGLAFDYRGSTHIICGMIDRAESKTLIDALHRSRQL